MINLLPRKEFTLTIGGKEYKGKFGTYAMKLFCNKKGIKLSEVSGLFPVGSEMEDILDNVIDFILCAIEYKALIDREKIDLRPIDFYVAIDNKEYVNGELMDILNHSGDPESKNGELEIPPTGTTSSEISLQPEENQTSFGQ